MADVQLGQPHQVGLTFREDDGSPQTTGVTATVTVTDPAGAAIVTAGALTHQGAGFWARLLDGTSLTAPGAYTATITVTAPSFVAPQVQTFTVGVVLPWMRTLREVLVALYTRLGEGLAGTSTGGGTTTLADSSLANVYATDEFVGSQLLILEPGAAGDTNPVRVTAYNATAGTFTFSPAVTAVVAGTDYLLVNLRGKGLRYERALAAITQTVLAAQARLEVSAEIAGSSSDYRYTVPNGWMSVLKEARYRHSGDTLGQWWPVAPANCDVQHPERRLIVRWPLSGTTVRIEGSYPANPPTTLTSLVELPLPTVVDRALLQLRIDRSELPQAQALAATSGAAGGPLGPLPRANEVFLA